MVGTGAGNPRSSSLCVGILAIQGAVQPHAAALARLGAAWTPVRREKDLDGVDALILPGGESTTISKGLERVGLYGPLETFARSGKPVLGTCAGAILMAREVENRPLRCLGLIDVVAVRNAYVEPVPESALEGRQPPYRGAVVRRHLVEKTPAFL